MRPGSIGSRRLRCGHLNSRCKRKGELGHGPNWDLTRKRRGKTMARATPAALANCICEHFAESTCLNVLTERLVEVSDRSCQARLPRLRQAQE